MKAGTAERMRWLCRLRRKDSCRKKERHDSAGESTEAWAAEVSGLKLCREIGWYRVIKELS